ncbi:MAG TPA: hypothetical protein VEY94_07690, partial [Patescibacteria group bacterium]|nr:hypothetical protein [Patescibacteria group bacterium]
MFIERKAIIAIAIALLSLAAPESLAAAETAPNPGTTLEAMAQQKFGPALTAAERKLIHFAPMRDVPWVGPNDNPADPANDTAHADKWGAERVVRADLIEWLLSDPHASQSVHPSGLALGGARVDGNLDLSYATVDRPLTLIRCFVPGGINLMSAHLDDIVLRHSRTGPIFGNGATVHGDAVILSGDSGPVSLMRARIDGTLDFSGTRILGAGEDAVNLVEANVGGDVLFHDGFTTDAVVYARLAKIGHDLSFHDVEFRGDGQLDAERAVIDGTFYWVEVKHNSGTVLDLEDAHAGAIWDDEASWPAPGNLMINGFVYGEIAGGPGDAPQRLRWLARQPA